MGDLLDTENFEYIYDANGELIAFPIGTPDAEKKKVLQRTDPDYVRYERDVLNNDVFSIPDSYVPTFPEYKQFLNNKRAKKEEQANRSLVDKAIGVGEAGLTAGSAGLSAVASPFVYGLDAAGQGINSVITGKKTNIQPMEQALMDIIQAGTYQPRTSAGQEYVGDTVDVLEGSKIEGAIGQSPMGKTFPMMLRSLKNVSKVKPKVNTNQSNFLTDMISLPSGIGSKNLKQVWNTAREGTEKQRQAFLDAFNNKVDGLQTVQKAKSALDAIRREIGLEYKGNKAHLTKDKSIIDFAEIDDAVNKVKDAGKFNGQVIKESTVDILQKITKTINDWKKLDPKVFHTPEGIDQLKQKIGDYYNSTKPYTDERRVLNEIYGSLGKVLRKNAPVYDDMMSSYESGKTLIRDIEDSLSVKEKANVDTQFRKLLSVMRDNVNTNFGERFRLAEKLAEYDTTLFPEIAGQSTKSWLPQGLQRAVGSGNIAALMMQLATGQGVGGNLGFIPLQMPKVVAGTTYGAGKIAQGLDYILPTTKSGVNSLLSSTAPIAKQPITYSLLPNTLDQEDELLRK